MAGIGIIGRYWLLPLLETALPSDAAAKAVTLAVIYLGMALFIRPMLDTRSPQYTVLWMKKRSFRLPLMALSGIRILLIALIAFIPLRNIAGIGSAWLLPVIVAALLRVRKKASISQWIFPQPTSPELPMNPGTAYRRLKTLLEEAGLPSIRFHDLRHTFATHALTSGVDAKTLAGILKSEAKRS